MTALPPRRVKMSYEDREVGTPAYPVPWFNGDHGQVTLRPGLGIHYCDGVDTDDVVCIGELAPCLSFYVFLSGRPEARVGGRPLIPDLPGERGAPQAVLLSRRETEQLERRGRPGQRMCKVAISLSAEWLADCEMDIKGEGLDLGAFTTRHMAQLAWTPDRAMAVAVEHILRTTPYVGSFQRLHLESRVIDLLAGTFSRLADTACPCEATGRLKARDLNRVRRAEAFLETADPATLSLSALADCAGVSVSTLQRLFRAVHGVSPVEYIRRRNLDLARLALLHEGISVKEAAFRAGYSSSANFSTAFRRQFGYPPGVVGEDSHLVR